MHTFVYTHAHTHNAAPSEDIPGGGGGGGLEGKAASYTFSQIDGVGHTELGRITLLEGTAQTHHNTASVKMSDGVKAGAGKDPVVNSKPKTPGRQAYNP